MAEYWWVMILLALCSAEVCEAAKGGDNDPCSVEQAVRLDAPQENATCGYVQGRVQICEDGEWKNLCDTQWTMEDAQVTCKSLNYTATGAQNRLRNQVSSGTSTNGLSCSGEERSTTQCSTTPGSSNNGDCNQAVLVLCFVDESRTSMAECVADTTTGSPGLTSPTSSSAGGTTSPPPGSTPQPTTSDSNPTSSPLTETDQSKGFFSPPALYYFAAGLAAAIIVILLATVVITATVCFHIANTKGRKNSTDNHLVKDCTEDQVQPFYESIKESTALPQELKQPVYEDITIDDKKKFETPTNKREQQPQHTTQDAEVPGSVSLDHPNVAPPSSLATKDTCICSVNPCYSVLESQGCSTNVAYGIFESGP